MALNTSSSQGSWALKSLFLGIPNNTMPGRNSDVQSLSQFRHRSTSAHYRLRNKGFACSSPASLQPFSVTGRTSFLTSSKTPVISDLPPTPSHKKSIRVLRIRRSLACISALNTALSVAVFVIGVWMVKHREAQDFEKWVALRTVLGVLSLVQTVLVIGSWSWWLRLREVTRVVIGSKTLPIPQLFNSPIHLFFCSFECLFHLLTLFPWLESNTDYPDLVICLFLQLLFLRIYHAVQWVYWVSDYSACRSRFYADITKTDSLSKLSLKSCLRQHGLSFCCAVISALATAGMLLTSDSDLDLENSLEAVIYALTRVRGNNLAELSLALCGCFLQGLVISVSYYYAKLTKCEDEVCATILYRANRTYRFNEAAKLIQRWWLMRKRHPGQLSSPTFVSPLQDLLNTKAHSSPCCFGLQRQAFILEMGIELKVRTIKEEVKGERTIILERLLVMLQFQYRVFVLCSALRKLSTKPATKRRPDKHWQREQLPIIREESSEYASQSSVSPL